MGQQWMPRVILGRGAIGSPALTYTYLWQQNHNFMKLYVPHSHK